MGDLAGWASAGGGGVGALVFAGGGSGVRLSWVELCTALDELAPLGAAKRFTTTSITTTKMIPALMRSQYFPGLELFVAVAGMEVFSWMSSALEGGGDADVAGL